MMQAKELLIKGRVQGVFYRKSAAQQAAVFGLCGYVKNLPDGNVFIFAQGEEQALQDLISWCQQGPPMAKVSSVEHKEVEIIPGLTHFSIRK